MSQFGNDPKLTPVELKEIRERSDRWASQERSAGVTQRDLSPVNASQAAHDRADLLDHIAILKQEEITMFYSHLPEEAVFCVDHGILPTGTSNLPIRSGVWKCTSEGCDNESVREGEYLRVLKARKEVGSGKHRVK